MGVKSLWSLLTPAGRPVMLETVEGKSMAIDSSIWIYQFQATMRDKDGRALVNAHVLGFLRRICKLLFYGIKPVFVFDGGAPALKRMTISERKKKKSGASESHAKIAEKLLAAQMRREALSHAESSSKGRLPDGPVRLDENTVYLEDIDGTGIQRTPPKKTNTIPQESPSPSKKARWRDYDPYRLPDIDMDAAIAKVTRHNAPDPRLATEDELRAFIDMMRPEDLDVNSPAFRELPTEVQYEIIGDLRLKSRQTSHKRLQAMLRTSKTPLDFSKAQISNLKQRNSLTQQLLVTTDNIGKAHVYIPVRIASERNREYMLVKNEGPEGGWVLGITDYGTEEKPILVDQDEQDKSDQESDDDDDDMEEVVIEETRQAIYDPDLREYQRENALNGISRRQAAANARGRPKASTVLTEKVKSQPLFIRDEDDEDIDAFEIVSENGDDLQKIEDEQVTGAIQASLEDLEAQELRKAMEESRKVAAGTNQPPKTPTRAGPSSSRLHTKESSSDTEDDMYTKYTPSRLDTALRFANMSRDHEEGIQITPPKGANASLAPFNEKRIEAIVQPASTALTSDDDDDDLEEITVPLRVQPSMKPKSRTPETVPHKTTDLISVSSEAGLLDRHRGNIRKDSDDVMEKDVPGTAISDISGMADIAKQVKPSAKTAPIPTAVEPSPSTIPVEQLRLNHENIHRTIQEREVIAQSRVISVGNEVSLPSTSKLNQHETISQNNLSDTDEEDSWLKGADDDPIKSAEDASRHEEEFDAANEIDVHEEEGEFARFAAQVKGKDLESMRREIDEEIRQLNQQRKTAMRDSEDVTQTMVAQIMTMLRLFGIPYITAPMEAEAQCAVLVELGLVDGVITDDSDVFLFGGLRVFKNMFNQSKTVECFLLSDLERELGLDRSTLIQLAYLLGSDYTEGLAGVGPVVAMELLREFPGDDGLFKFRDWWQKVQSGRDTDEDNKSSFKKRFKKRFKDLYLSTDWPNTAVRDAYLHPVVDASEEPFKWALPDLDGLRDFFRQELSWNAGKVDDLLLPIIHKMNKRGQEAAANRQGTLNDFFGGTSGFAPAEPRKRQAYASKRLQALVTEHRKAQKQKANDIGATSPQPATSEAGSEEHDKPPSKAKQPRKRKKAAVIGDEPEGPQPKKSIKGKAASRGGKGRNAKASTSRKRAKADKNDASSSENEFVPSGGVSAEPAREIGLRTRVRPRPLHKVADAVIVHPEDSASDGSEYHG